MQLLYPKIDESRGIVLVSPVHNYNVTAWMKAFLDRLYCYYIFTDDRPRRWSSQLSGRGRRAIVVTVGEQESVDEGVGLTLQAMRLAIEALGYEVIGELTVLGTFDKGGVKDNAEALSSAEALGSRLAQAIRV
jgi:multimeric flavodoxin WrbA